MADRSIGVSSSYMDVEHDKIWFWLLKWWLFRPLLVMNRFFFNSSFLSKYASLAWLNAARDAAAAAAAADDDEEDEQLDDDTGEDLIESTSIWFDSFDDECDLFSLFISPK